MSIIKSFSVGNGDMFYIEHGSDNFTIMNTRFMMVCQQISKKNIAMKTIIGIEYIIAIATYP